MKRLGFLAAALQLFVPSPANAESTSKASVDVPWAQPSTSDNSSQGIVQISAGLGVWKPWRVGYSIGAIDLLGLYVPRTNARAPLCLGMSARAGLSEGDASYDMQAAVGVAPAFEHGIRVFALATGGLTLARSGYPTDYRAPPYTWSQNTTDSKAQTNGGVVGARVGVAMPFPKRPGFGVSMALSVEHLAFTRGSGTMTYQKEGSVPERRAFETDRDGVQLMLLVGIGIVTPAKFTPVLR